MPKFVLPKHYEGQERVVIGDRYVFVNGEMPCSKSEALLLDKILGRFHGCTLVFDAVKPEAKKQEDAVPSLKVEATKVEATKK